MMAQMAEDTLATLHWLLEAGADEAIADAPVNRLVAKAQAAPMQAVSQTHAAVVNPCTLWRPPFRTMTPAPINPTPVTMP